MNHRSYRIKPIMKDVKRTTKGMSVGKGGGPKTAKAVLKPHTIKAHGKVAINSGIKKVLPRLSKGTGKGYTARGKK